LSVVDVSFVVAKDTKPLHHDIGVEIFVVFEELGSITPQSELCEFIPAIPITDPNCIGPLMFLGKALTKKPLHVCQDTHFPFPPFSFLS
jgi:hypothetical protein